MKRRLEIIALVFLAWLLNLATFDVVQANPVVEYGATDDYLAELKSQNAGRLAEEEKMLYTTAQKVPFTFVGFTNEISLNYVLQALNELGTKGTFFINERELQRYPDNIAKIAAPRPLLLKSRIKMLEKLSGGKVG